MEYWNTTRIRAADCLYNFVIGERSNGKTTALLRDIVTDYVETGGRGAIIRQMEEDIRGHRGSSIFNAMIAGGMIEELTAGEWTGVKYKQRAFFLTKIDEDGKVVVDEDPFCYIFSLSAAHHNKGLSYPFITTIFFDEFMNARAQYLRDEVDLFFNLISTLVREKAHAKIFLVANTVSWNAPYFTRFGLTSIDKMKPGELAIATTGKGENPLRIAIEYTSATMDKGGKDSDVYFAIDDARVSMITDGNFAIPDYPSLEGEDALWRIADIRQTYWIDCENVEKILRIYLIKRGKEIFTWCEVVTEEVYRATADLKRDIFFTPNPGLTYNELVSPLAPSRLPRVQRLARSIAESKMRFADNSAGEELRYYLTSTEGLTSVTR